MPYLALGALALLLVLWAGGRPLFIRRGWRFLSAAAALVAFAAAAMSGVRGRWEIAVVLLVMGVWLAASTRRNAPRPRPRNGTMTLAEARSLLGVGPEAGEAEIQAAYTRLMRLAHPDKGGTTGLAVQLNAARDRLLGR